MGNTRLSDRAMDSSTLESPATLGVPPKYLQLLDNVNQRVSICAEDAVRIHRKAGAL